MPDDLRLAVQNLARSEPLMQIEDMARRLGVTTQDIVGNLGDTVKDFATRTVDVGKRVMQTLTVPSQAVKFVDEPPPKPAAPVTASADQVTFADGPAPDFKTTNTKDASGNAEVDPNTIGTFARHVVSQVNPIPLGQALPFPKEAGGAGWDAPIQAIKGIGAAQEVPLTNAKASYQKGDYGGAAIHLLNYMIPLLGPMLDKSGNEMREGKYAAGLGDALGLAAVMFGPKAAGQAAQSKVGQAVADTADAMANKRVVDVTAPKIGANKVRFGRMAADVAPTLARETTGLTRTGVADSVAAKFEDATAALDEAANARNPNLVYHTKPILSALQKSRDRLTAQTVRDGRVTAGSDVVPAPNRARVAQIDQAMKEIEALGPIAKYEPLRRIREAYDGPAKAIYSPAMTTDYMTAQGGKMGAADVTGALREHLATFDPATAKANANYSLWKKASDVLTAAEETERVRPTVGRTLMARGLGAAAGGGMDGGLGAAVGAMVGPLIERTLAGASPAIKLVVARQLATMADALRAGDVGKFKAVLSSVQKMVPAGNVARAAGVPMAVPVAASTEPQP